MCEHHTSRRDFLRLAASCAAHVGLASAFAAARPQPVKGLQERFPVVASEPWGRLEEVAEGIWALVSTPLQDRTTLCNGGIIAGRGGVVVIEAFNSDDGARWMAEQSVRLTGRPPSHVVLTHYHSDHTGGLRGAREVGAPEIMATPVTRDDTRKNADAPNDILNRATPLDTIRPTELDLGNRSIIIVPRRGHTDSDVTVEVTDPSVIFCGDLVWNGFFPNYRDATPSRLGQAVRLLRATDAGTYVPGHGGIVDPTDLDRYLELLDLVEDAARTALEQGLTPDEAAADFALPTELGDWYLFRPEYYERALEAWFEELSRP